SWGRGSVHRGENIPRQQGRKGSGYIRVQEENTAYCREVWTALSLFLMIDWKKRIKPDGSIDMQGMPYYHISYSQGNKQDLYGVECDIPDAPPDEHCVGYGLSIDEQIF